MKRIRNRVARVTLASVAVPYVLLACYVARVDSHRDWDNIMIPVSLASLVLGGVGGFVLSWPGIRAAHPLGDRHQFWTALWRFLSCGWWGLTLSAYAVLTVAFAQTGVVSALAAAAALTAAGAGLVLGSRLRTWSALAALVTATALTVPGYLLVESAMSDLHDEVTERSAVADIEAHLKASRDFIAAGNRLYAFDESPIEYLLVNDHLVSEQQQVGALLAVPWHDGNFAYISHRQSFESDVLDGCALVDPFRTAVELPSEGETQCYAVSSRDAVARVTGTSSGTTKVVIEFVEGDQPVRLILLDNRHQMDSAVDVAIYANRLLDALVEYDPNRWTEEEIHDVVRKDDTSP